MKYIKQKTSLITVIQALALQKVDQDYHKINLRLILLQKIKTATALLTLSIHQNMAKHVIGSNR